MQRLMVGCKGRNRWARRVGGSRKFDIALIGAAGVGWGAWFSPAIGEAMNIAALTGPALTALVLALDRWGHW